MSAHDAAAPSRWADLPSFLVVILFDELLPADVRARCGCVCRAWAHATLRGPDAWRLWARLDLSSRGGVTCTVSNAALAGAAALARGRLQELTLSGPAEPQQRFNLLTPLAEVEAARSQPADRGVSPAALLQVVRDNAELRNVYLDRARRLFRSCSLHEWLRPLLDAAPVLRQLAVDCVRAGGADRDLLQLLRGEPPFGVVRVKRARRKTDVKRAKLDVAAVQNQAWTEGQLLRNTTRARQTGARRQRVRRAFGRAIARRAVRWACNEGE